ncbi:MAG: GtrA family protein [Actinomycetota bacterium]|jgi:putative flippase GtrA|nr:GtrA family protein [Actinomycetota bacterium]
MLRSLGSFARAQFDRKPVRYSLVSVVAVAASQLVLVICSGLLHWSPVPSNLAAVSIGSIPSYALNRMWVWGKRGRNDVWREVVPFWGFALLGLAFSTLLVHLAARWNDSTVVLSIANLSAFGVLWVAKYLFLDALLFGVADEELATT